MYIKSITIKNFLSYYEEQTIEFSKGLNLILGHIGTGKTNLFSAFYWCLYNEIYFTDIGKKNTNQIGDTFINQKAKANTDEEEEVETFVKMVIEKYDEDYKSTIEYSILRKCTHRNKGSNHFNITDSSFVLSFFQPREGDQVFHDNNAQSYIETYIFHKKISPYIWFQGESIDRLIDLKDSITFKSAIEYLSHLKYYDNIANILSESHEKIEKEKTKKIGRNSTNARSFNETESLITDTKRERLKQEELIAKYKNEKEEILDKIVECEKVLDNSELFPKLKSQKDKIEIQIKNLNDNIERKDIDEKINFTKKWMLKGMNTIFLDAEQKMTEFETWRQRQISNEDTLPEDVPGDQYIQLMINKEFCLVCERSAPDPSPAFNAIKNKLNRKQKSKVLDPKIEELNSAVIQLKYWPRKLVNKLDGVNEEIKEFRKDLQDLINERNSLRGELKEVLLNIDTIEKKFGSNIEMLAEGAEKNRNSYKYYNERKIELTAGIEKAQQKINDCNRKVKELNDKIDELRNKNDSKIVEINILKYTEFLKNLFSRVKDKEYRSLVQDIENQANIQYRRISFENKAIKGVIKINPETNYIKTFDEDDISWNPSKGHLTLIKMSIINSIIFKSNEYRNESFPFITDAPSSSLDDDTTKSYLAVVADLFEQSIVITKDLFNELINNRKIDKVSNIFVIEVKKDNDSAQASLSNAYSVIKKII